MSISYFLNLLFSDYFYSNTFLRLSTSSPIFLCLISVKIKYYNFFHSFLSKYWIFFIQLSIKSSHPFAWQAFLILFVYYSTLKPYFFKLTIYSGHYTPSSSKLSTITEILKKYWISENVSSINLLNYFLSDYPK